MSGFLSRRKFITSAVKLSIAASAAGTAAIIANRHGLIPPDYGGLYGPGETLTYAAQRLLTRHSLAREFPRSNSAGARYRRISRRSTRFFRKTRLIVRTCSEASISSGSLSTGLLPGLAIFPLLN